ncbi:MAG: hypothetical protein PHR35_20285 [Kiritimatiellae bacterium]|nr:hypothetical protein [Kiritimatiellia bacterium]
MNRWKVVLTGVIGILIGMLVGLSALPIARAAWDYFGPPRVTVMNATGGDISDVTVTLGKLTQPLPDMKDGHARTVRVQGRFGECSTHVAWTDFTGRHEESAGDYMESYGFYRAVVVLTPDGKAKAIYEVRESNRPPKGAR